jgi:hypothetical protein
MLSVFFLLLQKLMKANHSENEKEREIEKKVVERRVKWSF